jgi:glycosyltransferase involved in cell wall biosynthesis
MKTAIYFLCADANTPMGGHRIIYRHVDILNRNGFSAFVLHHEKGTRHTWFENSTKVVSEKEIALKDDDVAVVPETYVRSISKMPRSLRKVIMNMNCYYTFQGFVPEDGAASPYQEASAAIVISRDSEEYLRYAFPGLKVHRVTLSIDPNIFFFQENKRKQICFMPRKHPEDAVQVISMLKSRGALADFAVVPIDGKSEKETAAIMRESLVFLSFGYPEGFGLPPAEAMACGCVVIGYHGMAGREYFMPEFSYPIDAGEISRFAKTVEEVLARAGKSPLDLLDKGRMASEFIRKEYSPGNEEADVLRIWTEVLKLKRG